MIVIGQRAAPTGVGYAGMASTSALIWFSIQGSAIVEVDLLDVMTRVGIPVGNGDLVVGAAVDQVEGEV